MNNVKIWTFDTFAGVLKS